MQHPITCANCGSRFGIQSGLGVTACPACRTTIAKPSVDSVREDVEEREKEPSGAQLEPPSQHTVEAAEDDLSRANKEIILVTVSFLVAGAVVLFGLVSLTSSGQPVTENGTESKQNQASQKQERRDFEPTISRDNSRLPETQPPSKGHSGRGSVASEENAETASVAKTTPPGTADEATTPLTHSTRDSHQTPATKSVAHLESADLSDVAEFAELRYAWARGLKIVYGFEVSADYGNFKKKYSGTCEYVVRNERSEDTYIADRSGTGFVVSPNGHLLTAAHLLWGATRIDVAIGEKSWQAELIAQDRALDVALIKIPEEGLPHLLLADHSAVQTRSAVHAAGFSRSTQVKLRFSDGQVKESTKSESDADAQFVKTDVIYQKGWDGGPIVDSACCVAAMTNTRLSKTTFGKKGLSVASTHLAGFLSKNGIAPETSIRRETVNSKELQTCLAASTARISVSRTTNSRVFDIAFNAKIDDSVSNSRNLRGVPGTVRPGFDQDVTQKDRGRLVVGNCGEIFDFSGEENLPYVLGPVGLAFIFPLSHHHKRIWGYTRNSKLRHSERSNLSHWAMRSSFIPEAEKRTDVTIAVVPYTSHTMYQRAPDDDKQSKIRRLFKLKAVEDGDGDEFYLSLGGDGQIEFDRSLGFVTHYEDTLELQMADEKSSLSVDIRYDFLSSHHLTMEELSEEDDFPRDRTKRAQNEQRHSEWLDSMRWGGPRRVEDPVEGLGDIEKRPHEFFID